MKSSLPLSPAKFIVLDTSTLGELARDFFSVDAKNRRRSREFLETLSLSGAIPFLSWHHFEELIKHKDDDVASDRVAFLRNLPNVAWLRAVAAEPIGSIFDVLVWECRTILRYPRYSLEQVRDATRNDLIAFGTGEEALMPYVDVWREIRPHLWQSEERRREIVAIGHAKVPDISREKLSTFLHGKVRAPREAMARFRALEKPMAAAIAERGDKRIPNPEGVTRRFYDELALDADAFHKEISSDPARGLEYFGVSIGDFGPNATMEDFMELAVFRKKLEVVHKEFNVSWDFFRETVSLGKVPSWTIQTALSRHGQTRPEHKGSELYDRYILCLSAYCDLTYVDKQTKEDIRRAQLRSSPMRSIMRTVKRVQPYEVIRGTIEANDY